MRIRSIKPEFFHHEELFEAEQETGLPLRLAYIGLWCAADREGRFKWEPRRLGIQILPYDKVEFSRVLHALATRGYLVVYRVGDATYGAIPSFKKHQIVNNRERFSDLPSQDAEASEHEHVEDDFDAWVTRGSRDDDACRKEGEGRERKGKEQGSENGEQSDEKAQWHESARRVLAALNDATGKMFRDVDSNLSLISARMNESGVNEDGCIAMVRRMAKKWGSDPKMAEFVRPQTLFGREKFDGYYAARELPVENESNPMALALRGYDTRDVIRPYDE